MKKKNPLRLEMIRWFVSHTFLTLPVIFSCCGCAAVLFVAGNSSIQRNLPFSLSVDVCATLMVTCLIVFGLVTREHASFHRFYPHFHLYQPQLLLRRYWPCTNKFLLSQREGGAYEPLNTLKHKCPTLHLETAI